MPLMLADANLHRGIVRGLQRRKPDLDIIRAQDRGFERTLDPDLLEWAAEHRRVLLTHDAETMAGFAYERIRAGKPMAGLIEIDDEAPLGGVIEDILILVACLGDDEWENRIHGVPL